MLGPKELWAERDRLFLNDKVAAEQLRYSLAGRFGSSDRTVIKTARF